MNRILLLAVVLCFSYGCSFYRHVVVSEDGTVAPWYSKRDDKAYQTQWNKERSSWEIKNAEARFQAGQIDRSTYNRIRRQHGLSAAD
jgi:hypothetical protein